MEQMQSLNKNSQIMLQQQFELFFWMNKQTNLQVNEKALKFPIASDKNLVDMISH